MANWYIFSMPVNYQEAVLLMEDKLTKIINYEEQNSIFVLEHNDVYTAGTSHKKDELLKKNDINVIESNRGGKYTYHGPGQRIIYPIIDLRQLTKAKNIKFYIELLVFRIITTFGEFGIKCFVIPGLFCIWTGCKQQPKKIASIGLRVKKWVAYHGIAVNLSTDLSKFNAIVPCGIKNLQVTSAQKLGFHVNTDEFDQALKKNYYSFFRNK